MTTAAQVIEVARDQVGTLESPAGSNCQRYSGELGRPCEYWCADGVSWVLRAAGLSPRPNTASTRAMRDWFKSRGRFDLTPRPGDVGLMHLTGRNGAGQPDHVGFVVRVMPNSVETIEFNTSSGSSGSQDNGGGVFVKVRKMSAFIGFGHPDYSDVQEDDMTKEEHDALVRIDRNSQEAHDAVARIEQMIAAQHAGDTATADATADEIARRLAD